MKILHTLTRHAPMLQRMTDLGNRPEMAACKFVVIAIDGPESVNRQASWSSSFPPDDTHKIFQALADQTKQ